MFTHVSHLEPTFCIAPEQSPLLPSFSLIEIGPMSGEGLMDIMRAVYNNAKHLEMDGVTVSRGNTEMSFLIDEDEERFRRICIDGDIITVGNGATVRVKMYSGIQVGERELSLYI